VHGKDGSPVETGAPSIHAWTQRATRYTPALTATAQRFTWHPRDCPRNYAAPVGLVRNATYTRRVERKLATILFADLVGSTELGASLDPEYARDLLDRFYDAMAAEIALAVFRGRLSLRIGVNTGEVAVGRPGSGPCWGR